MNLWLIYFKGLIVASTHPRDQMVRAINAVRDRVAAGPAAPETASAQIGNDEPKVDLQSHHEGLDGEALAQIAKALDAPKAGFS